MYDIHYFIATITAIAVIIWKPHVSDRSDHNISQGSLKSGFHVIATIAESFFFQRTQRS